MSARRLRLAYLEGLRGWAALFVVFHHIWQFVASHPDVATLGRWFRLLTIFKFGGYAVPVFIVLSGYCLMLPVAPLPEARLAGGIWQFVKRRARRILPPYYAALGLSFAIVLACPRLLSPTHTHWDIALPPLTLGSVVSHLALAHNVFEKWRWTLNPPLWSVALEWQIYLVFALVLLPVWRRFGPAAALLVAYVLGCLPMLAGLTFAATWFLGLFALGMIAASINFSPRCAGSRWFEHSYWELISLAAWICVAIPTLGQRYISFPAPLLDSIIGVGTATFLVGSTRRLQRRTSSTRSVRLLEHPASAKLGEMSYSLYLIHFPIVAVSFVLLQDAGVALGAILAIELLLGVPAILAITWTFHWLFERPFMRPPAGVQLRTAPPLALKPALSVSRPGPGDEQLK